MLARTDRRKDRVEVGYEQLAAASEMVHIEFYILDEAISRHGVVPRTEISTHLVKD